MNFGMNGVDNKFNKEINSYQSSQSGTEKSSYDNDQSAIANPFDSSNNNSEHSLKNQNLPLSSTENKPASLYSSMGLELSEKSITKGEEIEDKEVAQAKVDKAIEIVKKNLPDFAAQTGTKDLTKIMDGLTIELSTRSPNDNSNGEFINKDKKIKLYLAYDKDVTPERVAQTLVHELGHASDKDDKDSKAEEYDVEKNARKFTNFIEGKNPDDVKEPALKYSINTGYSNYPDYSPGHGLPMYCGFTSNLSDDVNIKYNDNGEVTSAERKYGENNSTKVYYGDQKDMWGNSIPTTEVDSYKQRQTSMDGKTNLVFGEITSTFDSDKSKFTNPISKETIVN